MGGKHSRQMPEPEPLDDRMFKKNIAKIYFDGALTQVRITLVASILNTTLTFVPVMIGLGSPLSIANIIITSCCWVWAYHAWENYKAKKLIWVRLHMGLD